jgi:long-subunit fatty acid transport protein
VTPRTLSTIVAIVLVLIARPGATQDGGGISDIVSTNPGARSLGLGGAFAALADDATSAFANPAGLVQLQRPELSLEVRSTITTSYTYTPFDITPDISGVGFASFVYPFKRWAFALYSHQMASVEFSVLPTFPYVIDASDFTVQSYSAAAAFEINERLSLGLGFSYFDGDREASAVSDPISDTDSGVNAGLLWKPSPEWSLAAFYRQGPEFDVDVIYGGKALTAPRTHWQKSVGTPPQFSFPDVYGVGAALRPKAGALILSFEWDHLDTAINPQQFGTSIVEGGDEFHLGAEYAILRWRPVVAFRAGIWSEPERARNLDGGFETVAADGDRTHFSLGFGLAFRRFQFDAGFDQSDRTTIVSLSIVWSF